MSRFAPTAIQDLIETMPQLGKLQKCQGVAGGDISQAFRVDTDSGSFFAKTHSKPPAKMYEVEARSLKMMAGFGLPVPSVIGYSNSALLLEYIGPGPTPMFEMGAALGCFHRQSQSDMYGLDFDNYIGSSEQFNDKRKSWPNFFAEMRIGKQLQLIEQKFGRVNERQIILDFCDYLKDSLPKSPSTLVHGDLWGGNLYGNVFIDPAIYYGDREVDIAMTQMFGGFSGDFYTGYESVWPLDAGYQERIRIYNTYHQLNHYLLFGSGHYLSGALSTMKRCL